MVVNVMHTIEQWSKLDGCRSQSVTLANCHHDNIHQHCNFLGENLLTLWNTMYHIWILKMVVLLLSKPWENNLEHSNAKCHLCKLLINLEAIV